MLLTVKSTFRLRFIGITLNYHLTEYGKALIYAPFHESKHHLFGYFHKCKHRYLGYFHEYNHQDFRNLDGAILWRLKHIVSNERLNFEYNPNAKGYWYNVMVKWVTGETIT